MIKFQRNKRKLRCGFPGGAVVKNCPPTPERPSQCLVWEGLTRGRATRPGLQGRGATSPEPAATATEALAPTVCAPRSDKPSKQAAHRLQPERRPLTTAGEIPHSDKTEHSQK